MDEPGIDRRELVRGLLGRARSSLPLGLPLGGLTAAAIRAVPGAGGASPPPAAATQTASAEDLLAAAEELGLGARIGALGELARSSVRLTPAAGAAPGAVTFGGRVLLPKGRGWPHHEGRPLTFLAQVELGGGAERLLFFFDTRRHPSGLRAAHADSACVLLLTDEPLVATGGPSTPAAAHAGAAVAELVIPPAHSTAVVQLGLSEAELEAWQAVRERLASMQGAVAGAGGGAHALFGYPERDADEMALACELCSRGLDVPDAADTGAPSVPGAERWELLAQFSRDAALGWAWEFERLYLWADRDALRAGDTSAVWAIAR